MIDLNDTLATLRADGAAHELRFERRLRQPPAKVWAALTEPERVMDWLYARDVVIEPRVGGRYHLHFTNSDHEMDNVVTRFEPITVFEHSFGAPDSLVTWTLAPHGEGTALTLVHRLTGADPANLLRTLAGWHDVLAQLIARLDGHERTWDAAVWEGFRARYAAEYGDAGQPRGEVEYRGGEAVLRYDRLLDHPVEKVWAALSDPARLPKWFAEMDPNVAPGTAFRIHLPHAPQYKSQGVLAALEPGRVLAWQWDDSGEVRFELTPQGDKTRLVLTHTTPQPWSAGDFGAGWHIHLDALHRLLDTGEATAIQHDKGLEAEYVARFNPPPKPA